MAPHHPRTDSEVRQLINDDECASGSVSSIIVAEERTLDLDDGSPDLVKAEAFRFFISMQAVDIDPIAELFDEPTHGPSRVLNEVLPTTLHRLFTHPADGRFELVFDTR